MNSVLCQLSYSTNRYNACSRCSVIHAFFKRNSACFCNISAAMKPFTLLLNGALVVQTGRKGQPFLYPERQCLMRKSGYTADDNICNFGNFQAKAFFYPPKSCSDVSENTALFPHVHMIKQISCQLQIKHLDCSETFFFF